MGNIAFVFSGQGDQYAGMGRTFAARYPASREVFRILDGIRPKTSEMCFYGSEEALKETKNAQPCLFAVELAVAAALKEEGVFPFAAAGFSLGEVAAATFCGLFDLETGFRLVCKRGELMQREAEKTDTFMAAVVKLAAEETEKICEGYPEIYPVNFNCPGQTAVAGSCGRRDEFFAEVRAAGGRAIPLKVNGAFHSPFMRKAADAFKEELLSVTIGRSEIPLYSDLTAQPYPEGGAVTLLSEQICNPVQWEKLVRNLISAGADTFVEIGPAKTLVNMIGRIDSSVRVETAEEYLKSLTEK